VNEKRAALLMLAAYVCDRDAEALTHPIDETVKRASGLNVRREATPEERADAAWLWSQADALASDAQARCPDMRGLDAALAALDGDDT